MKNLEKKMPKTAILTIEWSFERSLLDSFEIFISLKNFAKQKQSNFEGALL